MANKSLATAITFAIILGSGGLALLLTSPPKILNDERREPTSMPGLTALASGTWDKDFDAALADRFPGRDSWRTINTLTVLNIFQQSDIDGRYYSKGQAGKFEAIDPVSAKLFGEKVAALAKQLPSHHQYYAVIPDKSLYLGVYPGYNPAELHSILSEPLAGLNEIDLTDSLTATDYYSTDLHWDQSHILQVVDALGKAMDFEISPDFQVLSAGDFWGVYAGQLALPMPPDQLTYLKTPFTQSKATYLNPKTGKLEAGEIYQRDRFNGPDPYDLFLGGAQPLIQLHNPTAPDRELVIFRDSFGSSLAPLLLEAYREITLVDLRYLNSTLLTPYVDISATTDVLFLYSSQVINHAETLLTPR